MPQEHLQALPVDTVLRVRRSLDSYQTEILKAYQVSIRPSCFRTTPRLKDANQQKDICRTNQASTVMTS